MTIPIPLFVIIILLAFCFGWAVCAILSINGVAELQDKNLYLSIENINLKRVLTGDQLSELEDEV